MIKSQNTGGGQSFLGDLVMSNLKDLGTLEKNVSKQNLGDDRSEKTIGELSIILPANSRPFT